MNNYAYPSIIIKVTIPLLLLQEFWSKLPKKKCRHWSTSILSQVLLCSSRSILNPRIFFCQTPSQIFLHFPVSHYESLWMESLYKAWFDGVDQLQMFFHTNLQLCNYIPSYFNKCHSMWLKRMGEKNCSQRFLQFTLSLM